MDKPSCFGQVTFERASPCYRCRLIGPCATKFNSTHDFGVLVWPRIRPFEATVGPGDLDVNILDASIMAQLVPVFQSLNLIQGKAATWWKFKVGRFRHRVLKVRVAQPNRVVFDMPLVSEFRARSFRILNVSLEAYHSVGCTASLASVDDAIAFATAATKEVFWCRT